MPCCVPDRVSFKMPWNTNRLIAAGLFLLAIVTRIPFQSQILYHWDSVNFALGTQRFDIRPQFEQPHPPGYIVYVGCAAVLNVLTHDPQTSYVWLSILASGVAVVLLFYFGARLFDRS